MRRLPTVLLAAGLALAGCASTPAWRPLPRPWTSEVVDVQRRIVVVLGDGERLEVERPRLEPDGAIAWRGTGPDARFPERRIPLERVADLETFQGKSSNLTGDRVSTAVVVAIGVVFWGLLLVGIFA